MKFRFTLSDLIWIQLYVALLAAVVGGLLYARHRALVIYGTEHAQAEWDTWREDVQEQSGGKGPVARRVPKSAEPPALVLVRDYFAICMMIAVGLSSVLFATLVIFIRGVLNTPTTFVDRSPPEPIHTTPKRQF